MIAICIIIIYLGALLLVSVVASSKIRGNTDFLVAGRKLGPILLAGALAATEIGGGSSLGVVEKAYGNWGLSAIWYVITMGVVFILLAIVTPKFRLAMVKTIPEYFERRYGKTPGIVSALFMMLFPMIGFTVAQFIVAGVLISALTGLSYKIAITIIATLIITYATCGGLWSVTLTDFIQVIVIVVGMATCLPIAIHSAGGWQQIAATIEPPKLSLTAGIGWKTIVSLIIMYFATFAVGQEILQKFYAAKNAQVARSAALIAAVIFALYAFVPALMGVAAYAMVKNGTLSSSVIMHAGTKYAFPVLAMHILPSFFVGILFAGLIGATVSCGTSDLLGGASIFANDVYKRYLRQTASDREVLLATRLALLALGIISAVIAMANTQSIIAVLIFSFSLRAAGFFIPYVLGHYWRHGGWLGTIAAMFFGSLTLILVQYHYLPALFGMEPIVSGLGVSLLVFMLPSTAASLFKLIIKLVRKPSKSRHQRLA